MELLAEELLTRPPAGRALALTARAALAVGRPAAALDSARRARRCRGAQPERLALTEGEALLGLGRPGEVLEVARRALDRRPAPDLWARLQLQRAEALGRLGRVVEGERLAVRAESLAGEALTRARLDEILGWLAWARHDPVGAQERLSAATRRFATCRHATGVVQALERQALVLRHSGRTREALDLVEWRLELAATTTRLDAVARAHHDRAALLADTGRLAEAQAELRRAHDLLTQLQHPQATTLVGSTGCRLALLRGDVPEARQRLATLSAVSGPEPRLAAETALLESDVRLVEGSAGAAEAAAARAIELFLGCRDERGVARARLRRASALLGLERPRDGLLEARRAARAASPSPPIQALAELSVGWALLRLGREGSDQAFSRAARLCPERESLQIAAAIGCHLAVGGTASGRGEVGSLAQALERTGDQRLLTPCLDELGRRGLAPAGTRRAAVETAELAPGPTTEQAELIDALQALGADGEWGIRVGGALHAVLSRASGWRAAWLGTSDWLWTGASKKPAPLPPADRLRTAAAPAPGEVAGPRIFKLAEESARRVVVPAREGVLVAELAEGARGAAPGLVALAALVEPPPDAPDGCTGRAPAEGLPGLIGDSEGMREVRGLLLRVAPTALAVHVFGETGTGKELVARALHERSRRSARPFVAVNAALLAGDLLESELFGHVRGAFTSAVGDRRGLVEEADGGTLFIDEVADLGPGAQAKLLRFCESGEFRRVGDTRVRRADVRLVSAANQPLEALVASGRFRADLWERLRGMVVTLPPLRERRGDLAPLARHFLRLAAAREGRPVPLLARSTLDALEAYRWPGNVRELAAEMACAAALCDGPRVERRHLSGRVRGTAPAEPAVGLRAARSRWEREFVGAALRRHGGRRAAAAAALGISRQALLEKVRSLGL